MIFNGGPRFSFDRNRRRAFADWNARTLSLGKKASFQTLTVSRAWQRN